MNDSTLDWDRPVGSAHAHSLIAILDAHEKGRS